MQQYQPKMPSEFPNEEAEKNPALRSITMTVWHSLSTILFVPVMGKIEK